MICIYHSIDLDGWMSAAIVKSKYLDVKLIGYNYGQPFPIDKIEIGEPVVMVDVSLPMHGMNDIAALSKNLKWIDHHSFAIKDFQQWCLDNKGESALEEYGSIFLDSSLAACEGAWKHLFPNEQMPELVRLLGRYDCFGHKGTDEELKVLQFQYAARSFITNPEQALTMLNNATDETIQKWLEIGAGIYNYLCTDALMSWKNKFNVALKNKFNVAFGELKFAMVNKERFNPVNFGIDYHAEGYDGVGCFHYANGKWNFSLYNDNGKVDVSQICKQHGGGGHKGAAGFVSDNIDFLFKFESVK